MTQPFTQPADLGIALPEWIAAFAGRGRVLSTLEERMGFVIEASRRNLLEHTGGPFAAAVFERDSGVLVALGVNLVMTQGLSLLHAEVLACALAQRKLGCYDLGAAGLPAHQLVSSAEPCGMCLGAVCWSGVRQLVVGARDADVRALGFDEGPKPADWPQELGGRGIEVVTDVRREQAAAVLRAYRAKGGTIYSARQG
jgi:tRNA(Arg) A34 adenosine deaminase TadA